MNKKNILIIIISIIAIFLVGGFFLLKNKDTDAKKFAEEYDTVSEDNVFVYRDIEEIKKILKNGTGIVYLGFPECPWCKAYTVYLNEVAKENGVKKVYYYNILNDRKENTKDYLEIVDILQEYLQYDDEGNKRIYVPSVIAVKDGQIVGFDDETAWDTKGYDSPEEYWENEDLPSLKNKLEEMISKTQKNICTSDCNK